MGETIMEELEREYCPPLDSALVYAILSDHDLNDEVSLKQARQTLDDLKITAEVEEASGFDPSGSSNVKDVLSDNDDAALSPSDIVSSETSATEITASFSAFTFEEGENGYDKGIDAMSMDEKVDLLKQMFSSLKPYDVKYALEKQKGDFGCAVEILLNQQFLAEVADEDGIKHVAPRGVDGFAVAASPGRTKKGKSKKNKNAAKLDLNTRLTEGQSSSLNRWQLAQEDVKFITDRTKLSQTTINSIYNSAGHSLRATVISICKRDPKKDFGCSTDADDAFVQSNIVDLKSDFPSVELPYIINLVLLTHPLMVSARELAEKISDTYREPILPQYANNTIEHETATRASLEAEEYAHYSEISTLPVNAQIENLRSSAFAQASAAYRRSRSNPLMGGAAAYYASIGHTANAAMKRSRAIEANSRVAAQSSQDMCDLHGVTVADANRIAKQYVERWWESRREYSRQGSTMGGSVFRVVVGRGAHSSSGVGKLGPAVAKMLKNEGWKVDEQVGELVIGGRVRK